MSEATFTPESFVRLPGLLRRWEIEQVLEPGVDLHVEEAGEAADGTPLFAVYRRGPAQPGSPPELRTSRRGEVGP